jgi:hypothetical protein
MAYSGAKEGQVIYYARNPWEEREEVVLVRYYKDRKDLVNPNCAVIDMGNAFHVHVAIKNLYRKAE